MTENTDDNAQPEEDGSSSPESGTEPEAQGPALRSSVVVERHYSDGTVVRMEGDEARKWLEENNALGRMEEDLELMGRRQRNLTAELEERRRQMLERHNKLFGRFSAFGDMLDLFDPFGAQLASSIPAFTLAPWTTPSVRYTLSSTHTQPQGTYQTAYSSNADQTEPETQEPEAGTPEEKPVSDEIRALREAASDESLTKADRTAAQRALKILGDTEQ